MIPYLGRSLLLLALLAQYSNTCLLKNGMSSVYLSAFEDLKPGNVIGTLPFESQTSKETDVELRVVKGNELVDVKPGSHDLILKKTLDRDEGVGKFEAVVECRSSNLDTDFSQLNISVFVTVKDINDNAPVFDSAEYFVDIKEELPTGTIVFTDFEATDNDQPGPNSFVQYTIVAGPHSHFLEIPDPFKPVITIKDRINYEEIKKFSVEIEARDQGEPSLASTVPLHVTIVDVNDLLPRFKHSHYTAKSQKNGVLVFEPEAISAQDGDRLNASLIFSLSGELSEHFAIDNDGSIRSITPNPPQRATFFVTASEREDTERNSTAILSIRLQSSLAFQHNTYSTTISPTTPIGSTVITVVANSENNTPLTYSLLADTNTVSIDEVSGNVVLRKKLEKPETLNVTASDGENVVSTALHLMTANSEESCRSPIKFEKFEYKMTIGKLNVLGVVNATSRTGTKITYILMNMNNDFEIDTNGVVKLLPKARLQCKVCELIVVAKSGTQMAITKINVDNPAFVLHSTTALTLLILIILCLIFTMLAILVCRKFCEKWKTGHRRSSICWLNGTTDTGISITTTTPNTTTSSGMW
ncbi:Cadherin domain-containing protein [Caenorhabditis elegans]|uniref:Cadherin domain-containing protein n=1 Tax=Caenorhabditis elegans TaxID=6239 RepID=A0A7R9SUP0_CAEEL|nr:Cadherin domain-containing protein [Caenorhabditis elegans]CAD8145072.1 Cadherin domain-containing protein [Caenorhabditis elegans]